MSEKCPQDGGFIGEGGCTHQNHVPSKLVDEITGGGPPRLISVEEFDSALSEGFTVKSFDGNQASFGKRLDHHIMERLEGKSGKDREKTMNDIVGRKRRLMFAVNAVMTTEPEANHRGIEGRKAYTKMFEETGVLVLMDKDGVIDDVFDIIPRSHKKRATKRGRPFVRYFFEYAPSGFEEVNPTICRESGLRVELTESKARTPIRFALRTLPQTRFEVNRK